MRRLDEQEKVFLQLLAAQLFSSWCLLSLFFLLPLLDHFYEVLLGHVCILLVLLLVFELLTELLDAHHQVIELIVLRLDFSQSAVFP